MKKAFTCFIEDKPQFIAQANNFFIPSFEHCCLHNNNTDILIFGPKTALDKVVNKSYVHKYEYNPVSYMAKFFNYHYANSITYIVDNQEVLKDYDYVLKSDADVFFLPSIVSLVPDVFTTGCGYYSSTAIQQKLKEESVHKNLQHRNYYNIGATWYGRSEKIIEVADLTTEIMLYLLDKHFSKEWGVWPGWYGGVCSMYASDLAINHLIDQLDITSKIDYSSAGTDLVESKYTAHCLHTDMKFSKFVFMSHNNKYQNINISDLDIKYVNDYCLYIAEKSRRALSNIRV